MDRANVLSGAAFKGAPVSALIFLAVIVIAGAAAYGYVQRTMLGVLEAQITEELTLFQGILDDGGPAGLREALVHLDRPNAAAGRAAGLFDPSGARLAGNIGAAPDIVGWSRTTLTIGHGAAGGFTVDHATPFYAAALQVRETRLVVSRSLDLVDTAERTLIRALALAGVFVIAAILLTGYTISRESLKKLQGIETALDRISQGDMAARLQVSPANDQIDRISRGVNAHLDRLARLMITTKATAAAIAHDLKTPLARAFLGLEQATAELDSGKDPRASIDSSLEELARLNTIFEAVLRIVRVEADAGRAAVVDLGPMVLDLAETFAPVAEDKGQTLTVDRGARGPFKVAGDARMVQQMIVNLLQNAVVHCPPGAQIAIGLSRTPQNIRLTVADTGPGIAPPDRAHAFEPFFRGQARGEGSGLGLALVKAIADRHHATATLADNAPGLRVEIDFPAADAL